MANCPISPDLFLFQVPDRHFIGNMTLKAAVFKIPPFLGSPKGGGSVVINSSYFSQRKGLKRKMVNVAQFPEFSTDAPKT